MRVPRPLALGGALTLLCLALGAWPTPPASASCVGPQLVVGDDPASAVPGVQDPAPVPVERDAPLRVAGQWFHEGCDDTGGGAGCAGPLPGSQRPMREVDLVLEQGGSAWTLGTADAGGASRSYAIAWSVRLPAAVSPGPAVLTAAGTRVDVDVRG